MALLLALLALAPPAISAASAEYASLRLPSFSISELQAPNDATLKSIGEASARLGMFAVTGFSDEAVAHSALSSFVSCAARGEVSLRQVEMEDGATRSTLATSTAASVPQPLPADAVRACPVFAVAANSLRAAVAATGAAYAAVLDRLLYGDDACDGGAVGGDGAVQQQPRCYSAAVRAAESLEHFHVFSPAPSKARGGSGGSTVEHTLGLHSDIGMFLVMTPAELFNTAAPTSPSSLDGRPPRRAGDLVAQLPDGRLVRPLLPEGGAVLLVMNGEGLTRWMRPAATRHVPYSPMHEVLSTDMGGGVRAWFGRMFMPPPSARLQQLPSSTTTVLTAPGGDGGGAAGDGAAGPAAAGRVAAEAGATATTRRSAMTFAEYRALTYQLFHEGRGAAAPALGCSPSRRVLVDEGSCGADQVFCWHSCMNLTEDLHCNRSEMLCRDPYTQKQWPQDFPPLVASSTRPGHCKNCTLACPASPPPSTAPATQPPSPSPPAPRARPSPRKRPSPRPRPSPPSRRPSPA
ncbi:hypothetical protein HXX76_014665 [Chlamydomonas incerta]|uniref:Fe2OG dioxygenase domain-containing protein n=1 Tax=Chlamydomonas incerta TaxID=51695 RepID=A0A835VPE1_CHLIN|nr:hypothetical protein HXX76_014665 [Chlamydomonas incerta]|eukprot:KAG2424287.1 hypothetical protein HXX76_014665 [Chlamydomonas incerta]